MQSRWTLKLFKYSYIQDTSATLYPTELITVFVDSNVRVENTCVMYNEARSNWDKLSTEEKMV